MTGGGRITVWMGGASRTVRAHPCRLFAATVVLFAAFPGIDLWASGLFYDPVGGFPPSQGPLLEFVLKGVPWLVYGTIIYLTLIWAAGLALRSPVPGLDGRRIAYLYTSILVGPALLVNGLFKSHWGRARPSQVKEFGGDAVFTPAWMMADQCSSNCSFTSGHAALGFWVLALALIAPQSLRIPAVATALAFGILVGGARIVVGGHFLSDTLFSATFVIALNLWLYQKMIVRGWPRLPGARIPGVSRTDV